MFTNRLLSILKGLDLSVDVGVDAGVDVDVAMDVLRPGPPRSWMHFRRNVAGM